MVIAFGGPDILDQGKFRAEFLENQNHVQIQMSASK
jgi:hypothetical protein